MSFSWECGGPYLSFGGSWEWGRKHRGCVLVKWDGFEYCQQNSCASSWQVLFSSLSQKSHPSRSKSHFSTGEAACLLARETEESVRSRNKKATGGGWEGRKDNNSQSKRSDRFSRSSSCIVPDTGTAFFFQLSCLLLSYVPLTLLLCPITYIWLNFFFQKSLMWGQHKMWDLLVSCFTRIKYSYGK